MVAKGLAVKRLDLVRAMVLSSTAVKIGTPALWQKRIATVRAGGMAAITDATMARWFSPAARESAGAARIRTMFMAQDPDGYCGCAAAIAGSDFITPLQG